MHRRTRGTVSGSAGVLCCVLLTGCVPSSGLGPAPDGPSVHFTASGDFSSSPQAAAVLDGVAASGADLHLALGDLSYGTTGDEQAWCDFVARRVGEEFPFLLLAGNHESGGEDGHIDAFAECLPNRLPGMQGEYARQYFVDLPQEDPLLRIVMISPGLTFDDGKWDYREGTSRYDWTAGALEGARDAGIPWVVVAMHAPCLSVSRYGCGAGSDVMNLLVEQRVDLVLSGHEHTYQRTHQLATGPGCEELVPGRFDAACIADRDSEFAQGAGTVFAVVGTGGVDLREVNRFDAEYGYMAVASGFNEVPAWGSLEVRVTEAGLEAAFRRAVGDLLSDSFTIDASTGGAGPGG